MNIHEYQAKKILSQYGISISKGMIAYTPHEAKKAAAQVSFRGPWMLKAQIQSGARNKGILRTKRPGAAEESGWYAAAATLCRKRKRCSVQRW